MGADVSGEQLGAEVPYGEQQFVGADVSGEQLGAEVPYEEQQFVGADVSGEQLGAEVPYEEQHFVGADAAAEQLGAEASYEEQFTGADVSDEQLGAEISYEEHFGGADISDEQLSTEIPYEEKIAGTQAEELVEAVQAPVEEPAVKQSQSAGDEGAESVSASHGHEQFGTGEAAEELEIDDVIDSSQIEFVQVDDGRTDVPEVTVYEDVVVPKKSDKVKIPVRVKRVVREHYVGEPSEEELAGAEREIVYDKPAPASAPVPAAAEAAPDIENIAAALNRESGEVTFGKVAVGAVAVGAVVSTSMAVADEFGAGEHNDAQAEELESAEEKAEDLSISEAHTEAEATDEIENIENVEAEETEPIPEPEPAERDLLCSLSVESEFSDELLEEALSVRDRLIGADVTTSIVEYRRAVENSPENLILRTDLADIHMRFGLFDDAINQYRQIIRRKPDSIALHHRLAAAYLWNEDFEEASEVFITLAKIHIKEEQYIDAIDVLQTALGLNPQNFKARRMLIDRFIQQDKKDIAIHHLRQFVDSALSLGGVDEAVSALKQLIELSGESVFVERLAKVYEDHNMIQEALDCYRQLLERYNDEENWNEALNVCEKLVALEPHNFEERHLLIDLYEHLERFDKVISEQFILAELYKEDGFIDEAAELYDSVVKRDPNHYEARRCLVDCYLLNGNFGAAMLQVGPLTQRYEAERMAVPAIDMYKKLIEFNPDSIDLREQLLVFYTMADQRENMLKELLTLDEIYEEKGEFRESIRYLRRAIELAPDNADMHRRLAVLYDEKLNSITAAMQEYKKVFELDPGDAVTMRRYAQLLVDQRKSKDAAAVLLKLKAKNEAEGDKVIAEICKSFTDKIAEDGADLSVRFAYGELCYYLNRIKDAIEQFQKTHVDRDLELSSRNMLGLAFIKMPRMREMAIRQFRMGLETKGHAEQEYLELRYNLAMLFYQTERLQEALTEFKSILAFDVTYRDVEAKVKDIQSRIAAGGTISKSRGISPRRR